ncbi:MAG: hypothetical protein IJ106_00065 [Parasporobacterium sp.]|nr:hypothetical protein [Parasporobacterium sp.]
MGDRFTDGYRGRIGLVATAPGNATEADFNRYRPEGVAVMTTRTPLSSSTPEGIAQMNQYTDAAVRMLAENAFCDIILLSSTAGSFLEGEEADRAKADFLSRETGTKVITSAGCMLKALHAVGAEKITLITPSSPALNKVEQGFLEAAGFTIAAVGGFSFSSPRQILCVSPEEVMQMVLDTDVPGSDAVLLSCSGLHVMEMIDPLEQTLGKCVLASNQFGLWGSVRELGITDRIRGCGRLFTY